MPVIGYPLSVVRRRELADLGRSGFLGGEAGLVWVMKESIKSMSWMG